MEKSFKWRVFIQIFRSLVYSKTSDLGNKAGNMNVGIQTVEPIQAII